jgi:hypothetical protein
MSTTERLAVPCQGRTTIIGFDDVIDQPPSQKDFKVPIDQPLFKPLPAEVHLQNYKPFQTYELLISFRNMDKVIITRINDISHSFGCSLRENSRLSPSNMNVFQLEDGARNP